MSNNSDQKVIVVCDFSDGMKDVIVHGARMADILKKELCLLALWKGKNQMLTATEKLARIIQSLKSNLPGLPISSLMLNSTLSDQIELLIEKYNAVLVVLHQTEIKQGFSALRKSSVPFLFVSGSLPEFLQYKNILVPVDFRKASKDASLWASYFGRFNKSQIHVIYATDSDPDQEMRLTRNVDFFKKFLSSLNVRHNLVKSGSSSWGIWKEVMAKSASWNGDAIIIAGSNNISLLDLLIGFPEKKLIRNAGNLPVLIINPRKDICVLCD